MTKKTTSMSKMFLSEIVKTGRKYPLSLSLKIMSKKPCIINGEKIENIDYKDAYFLRRFLNSQGKIYPPKRYRLSAMCQRKIARAVKRARYMG
ncbi:MAG TPA: 30S ribosomal protein S18, partial [Candidatus Moranbacteria bacterium]|nr:30S ribosomal protein S18 [Candidatus Moranbacteria bacterium]